MKKDIIIIFITVLIILLAFSLVVIKKDTILKFALERFVEMTTGCKMRAGDFSADIINTSIRMKDVRIYNPLEYSKDPLLLNASEIYVDFNLPAFFKDKKIHFYALTLDVKEYFFVRDKEGRVNGDAIFKIGSSEKKKESPTDKKTVPIRIDNLTLRIGKIISSDYSHEAPIFREFVFNVDQGFTDVSDAYTLVESIVNKNFKDAIFRQWLGLEIKWSEHTAESAPEKKPVN